MPAQSAQSLAIVVVQFVKQLATARISQGLENPIHGKEYATIWLHFNESLLAR